MIVVYTAILGGSDTLKPAPAGADQCVCFTDDPRLADRGWEIRLIDPDVQPRRTARGLKLNSHRLFPNAGVVVWIDGSIVLTDLSRLLRDAGDAEIACLAHPDRANCYAEGETVITLKMSPAPTIHAALDAYRAAGFAPTQLSTTGLLLRRNTTRVAAFNDRWLNQLSAYGTDDQVHVDFCAWSLGIPVRYLTGHYRDNPYMHYDREDHHARRQPPYGRPQEAA